MNIGHFIVLLSFIVLTLWIARPQPENPPPKRKARKFGEGLLADQPNSGFNSFR
jgi:hypothetical protein